MFESVTAAIRCAASIRLAVRQLGLCIRTGIHTGPCQTGGEKVSGLNVHAAARVMGAARVDEVLVSLATRQALATTASG